MFKVEIPRTDNAAFGDDDESRGREIGRILAHIGKRLAQGVYSGICTDENGNRVGEWGLSDDE